MRITDALFKVVEKNNLMPETELDDVKSKAKEWFETKAIESKVGAWVKKTQELWYMRIIVAYLFVFFNRWVWDYMHPEEEEDPRDRDE